MGQAPHVVQDEEGEALWFFGTLLLLKATTEQTGGRFCLCEQRSRRGMATPLHCQPADDETFVVLEGDLRFFLGHGPPITGGPGTTVHVPAGAPQCVRGRLRGGGLARLDDAQPRGVLPGRWGTGA